MSELLLIAHRGASRLFTENSMEAFVSAYNFGATHVETDVRMTSDGQLILFHDPVTTRFDGKPNFVSNVEYNYIKKIKLPKGERIVRLDELLEFLKKNNFKAILEIKVRGVEKETVKLVRNYNLLDNVLFWSFNHESIKCIHELCGDSVSKAILLTIRPWNKYKILKRVKECGADYLYPVYRNVDFDFFHHHKTKTVKYSNYRFRIHKFIDKGCSGIMTDDMEIIKDFAEGKL